MKDKQALRVKIEHLRKCYYNSVSPDDGTRYDGYGSMGAEKFVNNTLELLKSTAAEAYRQGAMHELKKLWSYAREHTITDIEMVAHHSGNTIDFIEAVDVRHFEERLATLQAKDSV